MASALLKLTDVQVGVSATTTNNFTMYQPTTPDGTVRWGVGNSGSVTDIVTLNSSGYTGIGTSSPSAKLHVNSGATDEVARFEGTGSPFISIYDTNVRQFYAYSGSDFQLMVDTNKNLSFGTNSATQMTLDTSGNLGLGVTPSAWASFKALELKTNAFISWQGGGSGFGSINYNAYYNGGYKRIGTDYASQYYQQTGCHFFGSAGSGSAGSAVTFSPTLTINANGALALQGATIAATGVGITFPATQSASSDANTLDDYEEGSWTPVPKFGGANVGMSYSSTGKYTKIGNLVFVEANFAITTNGSSTGNVTIEGLPFTSSANAYAGELIGDGFTFTGASISAVIESSGTVINLAIQTGGTGSLGGYSYMQQSAISTGGKRICMTYLT
jgi:hypothetical protein